MVTQPAGNQTVQKSKNIWAAIWVWAGRVPLRSKIIGIVIAPLLILGTTMAWWVQNELGGWLSYLLSEERVAQAMSVGMRGVFIVTLIAAVAGLAIAWFLTWLLTRPLLQITYIATHVKNGGDLSLRAPVWANDEIGHLGHAFNAMIDSLQRSRDELKRSNQELAERNNALEVLYELAQAASQPLTHLAVLDYSLQRSLAVVEADAGMLLTYSSSGALTVATSYNLSPQYLAQGVQSPDVQPFFLDVMRAEEPRHIPDMADCDSAPAKLIVASQQEGLTTAALFPLQGKNEMLGLWIILFRQAVELSARDRRLLNAICGQLSVALENTRLWEKLQQKERIRAQLLNRAVSAQEEERRRLSRELHDETGQSLTSLLVQLKVLERNELPEGMKAQIGSLRQMTANTLQEVRRLAADLRPAVLDDLGLLPALEGYIDSFAEKTAIAVTFEAANLDDVHLSHEVESTLYRVIQESLTNIARHAEATRAEIAITREDAMLHIRIEDNGCGFDVDRVLNAENCGLGLLGMRERIELANGVLKVTAQPGRGTSIHIDLPLPQIVDSSVKI